MERGHWVMPTKLIIVWNSVIQGTANENAGGINKRMKQG